MDRVLILFFFALLVSTFTHISFAGSVKIIDSKPSGASGQLTIQANVINLVSLEISDTSGFDFINGSTQALNFGQVDPFCTFVSQGLICLKEKTNSLYTVEVLLKPYNSGGAGHLTLKANRIGTGTLNPLNGLAIDNDKGDLENLTGGKDVIVLKSTPSGSTAQKSIGIRVHTSDSGDLYGSVIFTLSSLD